MNRRRRRRLHVTTYLRTCSLAVRHDCVNVHVALCAVLAIVTGYGVFGSGSATADENAARDRSLGRILNQALTSDLEIEYLKSNGGRASYQRGFFILGAGFQTVQVALVIDATSSMSHDIETVRQSYDSLVKTIKQQSGAQRVEIAFVLYRDLWKGKAADRIRREQPVEVLAKSVTGKLRFFNCDADRTVINKALAGIQTEPGTPGPEEQIDRGVFAALDKLNWSTDRTGTVGRFIFVAGDNPPWPEEYLTKNPPWRVGINILHPDKMLRGHSTDDLIVNAMDRDIRIFTVACFNSDPGRRSALNTFMERLARGTLGQFVDTHNDTTMKRLQAARPTKVTEIGVVLTDDLEKHRQQHKPLDIAFLPIQPIVDIKPSSFRIANPAARTAYWLYRGLCKVDARAIRTIVASEQAWQTLENSQQVPNAGAVLEKLARELDVDVLIGGTVISQSDGNNLYSFQLYGTDGQDLGTPTAPVDIDGALNVLMSALDDFSVTIGGERRFEVAGHTADNMTKANLIQRPLLLDAYFHLTTATAYAIGSEARRQHMQHALNQLNTVLTSAPDDAEAHWLLAKVHDDLGNSEEANLARGLANKNRETATPQLQTEIAADHALFIEERPKQAIALYRKLISQVPRWSATARRARWMLAGIYLGHYDRNCSASDLGFANEELRIAAVRETVLDILMDWPISDEARFYRKHSETPIGTRPAANKELPLNTRIFAPSSLWRGQGVES